MSGVVGFVGLDSFSFELASSLLRSGFKVQAFEISTELVEKFIELGGHKCDSPADVGKGIAASECVVSYKAFETLRYMEMSSEHLI
jgi:3-hydroxyisobutyrate dehydrogenase-like beta-hydroxyacid dehydrogenase